MITIVNTPEPIASAYLIGGVLFDVVSSATASDLKIKAVIYCKKENSNTWERIGVKRQKKYESQNYFRFNIASFLQAKLTYDYFANSVNEIVVPTVGSFIEYKVEFFEEYMDVNGEVQLYDSALSNGWKAVNKTIQKNEPQSMSNHIMEFENEGNAKFLTKKPFITLRKGEQEQLSFLTTLWSVDAVIEVTKADGIVINRFIYENFTDIYSNFPFSLYVTKEWFKTINVGIGSGYNNYQSEPYSIKLSEIDDRLISPLLFSSKSIRFWAKANPNFTTSYYYPKLIVEGLNMSGVWEELYNDTPFTGGETIDIFNGNLYRRYLWRMTNENYGAILIDDISIPNYIRVDIHPYNRATLCIKDIFDEGDIKAEVYITDTSEESRVCEKITIYPDFECLEKPVRFAFLNSDGGIDHFTFKGSRKTRTSISRTLYEKQLSSGFSSYERGKSTLKVEADRVFEAWTGFETEDTLTWLMELFESQEVFVVENGVLTPVNITTKSATPYDEGKLQQLEITYELSNPRIVQNG